MSVEVRTASVTDLDVLIQLNQTVQTVHAALYPADFRKVVDPHALRTFLKSRLDDPKSVIGIAVAEGVPVGYVWFDVQARPETPFNPPRLCIYVHHVSVTLHARRQGIGAALMQYVEQRAFSEVIEEIALDIWAANLDAQRFFSSLGFAVFNMVLRKKLGGVAEESHS